MKLRPKSEYFYPDIVNIFPEETLQLNENKGKILLVDDEPDALLFLKELLQNECYKVESAISGKAALTALAKQPMDIMITDVRMLGMDGIELIKQAGQLQPSL